MSPGRRSKSTSQGSHSAIGGMISRPAGSAQGRPQNHNVMVGGIDGTPVLSRVYNLREAEEVDVELEGFVTVVDARRPFGRFTGVVDG